MMCLYVCDMNVPYVWLDNSRSQAMSLVELNWPLNKFYFDLN